MFLGDVELDGFGVLGEIIGVYFFDDDFEVFLLVFSVFLLLVLWEWR